MKEVRILSMLRPELLESQLISDLRNLQDKAVLSSRRLADLEVEHQPGD